MCPDYDDFGNIIGIDRGGTAADMTYDYDLLHGWVKEISSSGGFEQRLYREDNTGHEFYNGSISAMTWKVPGQNYERRYDYTYDGMNRLVEGAYSHLPVLTPHPGIISSTGEDVLSMGGSSPLSLIPVIDALGGLVGPININVADQYTERISYDKNSNITSIERYGMNNQRQYGLIDSLVITRNGNQLKTIEDYAEKHLTYTGASDFYDGCTYSNEYYYNANGALESDLNRDIDLIQYDDLGNARCIYYFEHDQIEYIYAADGTKLRTIHRPASSSALTDSIDYIGNLILKNGQPSMYLFDGGYATFNSNGAVNGWHYYIQDYMGNTRMVVNKNGTTEQITHYYPYGGVIGDISTNESLQAYKFEGKELDRTFGLDNYDIHARQYFAMMPSWDRIDRKAEDYYQISPYSYCGGDPVNKIDRDGNVPAVVIGAVIGGVWKGAEAAYNGKNWEQVASAALGGAIDGAITASGGSIIKSIVNGAVGGSVGELVSQFVDCCTDNRQYLDFEGIGISGATGALTGGVVGVATKIATPQICKPEYENFKDLYQTKAKLSEFRGKAKDKIGSNNSKLINKEGKRLRESEAKKEYKKAQDEYKRKIEEIDNNNAYPQSFMGIGVNTYWGAFFDSIYEYE